MHLVLIWTNVFEEVQNSNMSKLGLMVNRSITIKEKL